MKKYSGIVFVGFLLLIGFQNCQENGVDFSQVDQASTSTSTSTSDTDPTSSSENPTNSSTSAVNSQTQATQVAEVLALKNKNLILYGVRTNGQLALIAEISEASNVPLYITLSKSCGTINDNDIAGNGIKGQFIFRIPKGMKQSSPVILSAFPSGNIVWKVQVVSEVTGQIVTDVLQTCAPWLRSGGGNLCPAPAKQPYCQDRG